MSTTTMITMLRPKISPARRRFAGMACLIVLALAPVVGAVVADDSAARGQTAPAARTIPGNLLAPLPTRGAIPPIAVDPGMQSPRQLRLRAEARGYPAQIRAIARRGLGRQRNTDLRAEALSELSEFTDVAALMPLIDELQGEADDVRRWLLEHLAIRGAEGQAALAYLAISTDERTMRDSAAAQIQRPASAEVLMTIDAALRDTRHAIVNSAGWLAGQLNALEAIPPLIFAQAVDTRVPPTGDLAWIAIGTTTTYVANVVPVVGGNAGAFQPVLGTITEGSLLRVMDAVVTEAPASQRRTGLASNSLRGPLSGGTRVAIYRLDAHNALVAMTSAAWGRSTAELGFDMRAWYRWFNEEFVPHMRNEDLIARVAADVVDD